MARACAGGNNRIYRIDTDGGPFCLKTYLCDHTDRRDRFGAERAALELLSRGRKYQLGLVLAHQYPAQLPTGVQDEILGNVHSIVAFGLGGKDAQVIRRELLEDNPEKGELAPISATRLIDQKIGPFSQG